MEEYMKIIKPPRAYDMQEYRKDAAFAQCETCPFCGKTRLTTVHRQRDGKQYCVNMEQIHISSLKTRVNWRGKQFAWYEAECNSCGARWASDEFEYGS